MKKKILSFLLCVAAALSLTACGEQGQTDSSDSLPKINDLELLSGAATGSWYTIGAGIADKFNDNYDGFPMTAIPGPGSIGNVPVIASGDSEIGMSYGPFLIAAQNGKAPFETSYTNLRAICAMQPTAIQPLTTLDIDTFGEFVNGKIKDGSLSDAWSDRHVAIMMPMQNVPASSVTESLVTRSDGHLFSLDDEVIEKLVNENGFSAYTIPAGTYEAKQRTLKRSRSPLLSLRPKMPTRK